MSKLAKIWLIVALVLIISGSVIFASVMTVNGWDFTKLSTMEYVTNTYEHVGKINNIIIETSTADITLEFQVVSYPYGRVECYEMEKAQHSVSFEDGNLVIKEVDNRKWYDYIGINFDTTKITVCLPHSWFDNVTIKTSTGDVQVKSLCGTTINISVTTGDTTLTDVQCNNLSCTGSTGDVTFANLQCDNLICTGSTGDVTLSNVVGKEDLTVVRSTGDVALNDCDAATISVRVATGDVTGNLLSGKIFNVNSSTGTIAVPENSPGGICNITTTTGDIHITANMN